MIYPRINEFKTLPNKDIHSKTLNSPSKSLIQTGTINKVIKVEEHIHLSMGMTVIQKYF